MYKFEYKNKMPYYDNHQGEYKYNLNVNYIIDLLEIQTEKEYIHERNGTNGKMRDERHINFDKIFDYRMYDYVAETEDAFNYACEESNISKDGKSFYKWFKEHYEYINDYDEVIEYCFQSP